VPGAFALSGAPRGFHGGADAHVGDAAHDGGAGDEAPT
jgi:hypothetical protein